MSELCSNRSVFRTARRASTLLVVVLLVCLGACDSNNPVQSKREPFSIDRFPHKVGDAWIYQVSDSASGTVDTMTVLIADTVTPPQGFPTGELWTFSAAGTPTDSVAVYFNDSTVVISSQLVPVFIPFPLSSPPEKVIVPAGTFTESYPITAGFRFIPDSLYFIVRYWLVKDKGIVKFTYEANTTTPALSYKAELIGYELSK